MTCLICATKMGTVPPPSKRGGDPSLCSGVALQRPGQSGAEGSLLQSSPFPAPAAPFCAREAFLL